MREPAWRKTGTTPDYRFSLANERTFLAWIRTSLALIAGALAIDQLAPDIAPAPLRIALCVVLAVIGAGLAALSYRRWGPDGSRHAEQPRAAVFRRHAGDDHRGRGGGVHVLPS